VRDAHGLEARATGSRPGAVNLAPTGGTPALLARLNAAAMALENNC
jgi:hypothetical protein